MLDLIQFCPVVNTLLSSSQKIELKIQNALLYLLFVGLFLSIKSTIASKAYKVEKNVYGSVSWKENNKIFKSVQKDQVFLLFSY